MNYKRGDLVVVTGKHGHYMDIGTVCKIELTGRSYKLVPIDVNSNSKYHRGYHQMVYPRDFTFFYNMNNENALALLNKEEQL